MFLQLLRFLFFLQFTVVSSDTLVVVAFDVHCCCYCCCCYCYVVVAVVIAYLSYYSWHCWYVCRSFYRCIRAGGNGPAGPVLAGPVFLKVK